MPWFRFCTFLFSKSMYPLNIKHRVELNIQGFGHLSHNFFTIILFISSFATPRILIFFRLPYCLRSSILKNVVLTNCFNFSFSVLIFSYFSLISSTSFRYSTSSINFLVVTLTLVSCCLPSSLNQNSIHID